MSKLDLYRVGRGRGYVIDLQTDFLESYSSRVVAPVVPLSDFRSPAKDLNPVVEIEGEPFVIQTHFLAATPVAALGKPVGRCDVPPEAVTRALDLLFQGY